jgi:two-component system, OmpR family, response regulator VicR
MTSHLDATVLIVEDDVAVARTFAHALDGHGLHVVTARDADEALRDLDWHPDVIVLDFRMPMINGLGLLYRIRALPAHQHTPVLVVTGDTTLSLEVQTELGTLGAQVRFKPIEMADLAATVAALLTSRHRPDEATVTEPQHHADRTH